MKTNRSSHDTDTVNPIPEGFHTVTPYLIVSNAQGLLDFIVDGLGGKVEFSMKQDDGKITHATARIGESVIMVSDLMKDTKPTISMLYLYVEDVDRLYARALKVKGTKVTREVKDEFYGDRSGCITDAWGNHWWIATHVENVSEAELEKRKSQAVK
jgi:PhnB protein